MEATGRQEQVENILSPEGSFPGPWFSAYLLGKDGICLQPPHRSSTSSPTHHWWYESFTLLEACPVISSEVRWAVLLTPCCPIPRIGAFHMEKSESQYMSNLMVPQPITHAGLLREEENDILTQT